MVREKDAAKKRVQERKDFLEQRQKEIEENTVRIKWQVIEHTPAYNTGGYYDQDIPAKNVVVADGFQTKEAADEWVEKHEPDPGNTLYVKKRRLVRYTEYRWL